MKKIFFCFVLSSLLPNLCFAQDPDERQVGTIDEEAYDFILRNGLYAAVEVRPDTIFGQHFVDLGLPSGLIWAEYNVGVSGVNDDNIGNVFNYDKLSGMDISQLDAYGWLNDAGNLVLEFDEAFMTWDYPWCLPTLYDFQELIDNTTSRAAKRGNQYGIFFTSIHNGRKLFFPAHHIKVSDGGLTFTACYMSSTPNTGDVADDEWSGLYIQYEGPENASHGAPRMDYSIHLGDGVLIRPVYNPDTAYLSDAFTEIPAVEDEQVEEIIGDPYTEIRILDEEPVEEETVFVHAEEQPQFPGGQPALFKWIDEHIIYPPNARDNQISGRVVVQVVVTKNGDIGEVKVMRSKDSELDAEAIRVAKSLPKFTPGKQEGVAVNSWYTIPVSFKLPISE